MVLTKQAGTLRLIIGALLAIIAVVGCGDDGSDVEATEEGTAAVSAIPTDASIVGVVATSDAGWIATVSGEAETTLWRVDLDGEPREVGTVEGQAVLLSTNDREVFVVSTQCADDEVDCDTEATATVETFATDGTPVGSAVISRSPGEGTDATYQIGGVIDEGLWVGGLDEAVQIGPDGSVRDSAGHPPGPVCAIEEELFAIEVGAGTQPDQPDPAVPPTVSGLQESSTHTVWRFADTEWSRAESPTISLPAGATDIICTPAGYEAVDLGRLEVPSSLWTPAAGQRPLDESPLPDEGTGATYRSPHGDSYVVDIVGGVHERRAGDTEFSPIDIGPVTFGEMGPSIPHVDASDDVIVWCTSTGRTSNCEVELR